MEPDDLMDLMNAHQDAVYRFVKFLGADSTFAQELTVEVFISFYRKHSRPYFGEVSEALPALLALAKSQYMAKSPKKFGILNSKEGEFLGIADKLWISSFPTDEEFIGKLQALHECVSELPKHHTEMLNKIYKPRIGIERLGENLDQKYKTVLPRIRRMLANCVKKRQEVYEYPRAY